MFGFPDGYNSSDWKTLSFTYVEYPRGETISVYIKTHHQQIHEQIFDSSDDVFGKVMAILALAPLWIGSVFTGLIMRCRDLHTVSLLSNIYISSTFRNSHLHNDPINGDFRYFSSSELSSTKFSIWFWSTRSESRGRLQETTITFSMGCLRAIASSCSSSQPTQSSSYSKGETFNCSEDFHSTKIISETKQSDSLIPRFVSHRLHHNSPVEKVLRAIAMTVLGFVTVFVCIGRVYLLYHTISQVVVGAVIGTSFGLVWFLFVHVILTPYVFPRIVSWKISELLLIRDTSLIPNIMLFEYTRSRQESIARSRKNMKQQWRV